ncbi:MAG: pyridoxal-phosphate dependent enzyme [Candidatus Latescibacteria bacterium]|jgi:threonine dehydratase|nr:pyridoxal-phosphate dependent enzyme [Candidatus Latescibacterota bacterium]
MITLSEIEDAARELPSQVLKTPLLRFEALSKKTGADLLLKAENLQVTGSYKSRAAFTILNKLTDQQKERGAAISSSGNFAAAFAYMGTLLGIPTSVVMMKKTSPFKVERTRQFGAEVVFCDDHNQARWDTLEQLAVDRGLATINTWEDANVLRGHGTLGLEILDQAPNVDAIVVPVSSSGLIAGIGAAVKSIRPEVKIIGVQPEGSQALYQSFRQKSLCEVDEPNTICDALIAARPGAAPFEHVLAYVDDVVLVSDDQAKKAIRELAGDAKLVAEPGGAVAVAAVQAGVVDVVGKTVVAVVSGGNIAQTLLGEILRCE